MRHSPWICALLLIWLGGHAAAAGIRATVASRDIVVDQPFLIQVDVEGEEIGDVILPDSDDLGFTPTPSVRNRSTNITMLNGQIQRSNTLTLGYTAWAKREGEVTIPPLQVSIDGQKYSTQSIKILARKAEQAPQTAPRGQNPLRTATSAPSIEDVFRLEAVVDKTEVFQGEPITLNVRVLELQSRNVDLIGRPQLQMPDTEGFFASPEQQFQSEEIKDGWPYQVQEVRQILFPTGVGEYTIPPAYWQGQVRVLIEVGMRNLDRTLETDPIQIKVKPLPDKPAGFSGAVGQFDAKLGIKDQTLVQGVPTELEFSVIGRGNSNAVTEPNLPELPWAHLSGPEVDTQHDEQDWSLTRKTFTYTLTPLQAGEFEVPQTAFVFFHPDSATYKTDTLPRLPVQVKASKEGNQLVVLGGSQGAEQQAVQILAEGLQPNATGPAALQTRGAAAPATLLFLVAPPLAYGAFFFVNRRRQRLANDPAFARKLGAAAKLQRRLAQLNQSREPSDDLYRAVVGYIADHYNVSETGMTAQDAAGVLEREGVPQELREQLLKVLRACERRRYGGGDLSAHEVQALSSAALAATEKLEHGKP